MNHQNSLGEKFRKYWGPDKDPLEDVQENMFKEAEKTRKGTERSDNGCRGDGICVCMFMHVQVPMCMCRCMFVPVQWRLGNNLGVILYIPSTFIINRVCQIPGVWPSRQSRLVSSRDLPIFASHLPIASITYLFYPTILFCSVSFLLLLFHIGYEYWRQVLTLERQTWHWLSHLPNPCFEVSKKLCVFSTPIPAMLLKEEHQRKPRREHKAFGETVGTGSPAQKDVNQQAPLKPIPPT